MAEMVELRGHAVTAEIARVYAALGETPMTAAQVVDATGTSKNSVYQRLKFLLRRGLILVHGDGGYIDGCWNRYSVAPDGTQPTKKAPGRQSDGICTPALPRDAKAFDGRLEHRRIVEQWRAEDSAFQERLAAALGTEPRPVTSHTQWRIR